MRVDLAAQVSIAGAITRKSVSITLQVLNNSVSKTLSHSEVPRQQRQPNSLLSLTCIGELTRLMT